MVGSRATDVRSGEVLGAGVLALGLAFDLDKELAADV
jgi:hypothetical protein